jgi:aryl-alcohol dehydrogenase-like predicted oxidoreductase
MNVEFFHRPSSSALNRREFLRTVSAATAGATISLPLLEAAAVAPDKTPSGIPLRTLGRTGAKVTIFGLGTAGAGSDTTPGAENGAVFEAALEAGVNYVDTAAVYGSAEKYLGDLMPRWRDKIFLAAKAMPTTDDPREAVEGMRKSFENTLRLLRTDHVDLLHIHSVGDRDPKSVLAPDGPLDFVRRLKAEKKIRFIGITGHNRVGRYADLIRTGDVDVIMVVLNFADEFQYRFGELVLPVAREHRCGILAMKVFGGRMGPLQKRGPSRLPQDTLSQSFRYSLGIPDVASAVVGPYTIAETRELVQWAKTYRPLSDSEKAGLLDQGRELAPKLGAHFGPVT